MKITLERYFYPVGQGLCCRERFIFNDDIDPKTGNSKEFNLVYDCGSRIKYEPPQRAKDKIRQYFKGLTIDALILSHYHNDHVNLVKTLKDVAEIKYLLIPDLSNKKTNNETRAEYNFLLYIDKGVDTDLLFVSAKEKEKYYDIPVILLEPDKIVDLFSDQTISRKLAVPGYLKACWHMITYNYQLIVKNPKFIKAMTDAGLYDKLSDEEYVSHNVKEIGDICKKIKNPNEQSTVLFSYPQKRSGIICENHLVGENSSCLLSQNQQIILCNCCKNETKLCCNCYAGDSLIGCVYFGDYPLNTKEHYERIRQIYETSSEYTGTIQFPHHGSTTGNNKNILEFDKKYVFSYGFGTKHPAKTSVEKVSDAGGCPIFVNDYSGYIQHILEEY